MLEENILGKPVAEPFSKYLRAQGVDLLQRHYLLIMDVARELSTIARHEGEILEFIIILGREYHLQTFFKSIYRIPEQYWEKYKIAFSPNGSHIPAEKINNVVSRIVGHYALFSRTGVGVFARFDYEGSLESIVFTDIVSLEGVTGFGSPIRQAIGSMEQAFKERITLATKLQPEVLALTASGDGRVRVYHAGAEVAEYYHGKWVFLTTGFIKFAGDLDEKLKAKFQKTRLGRSKKSREALVDTIKMIYEIPGKGASLIIGNYGSIRRRKHSVFVPATELLRYVDGQKLLRKEKGKLLFQVATMDGATIIDSETLKVYGRIQLPVFNWRGEGYEERWRSSNRRRLWKNYYKVYRWGIRHLSALGITAHFPGTIAVVISSDGPISVLEGGRGLDNLGYPYEEHQGE